MSDETDKLRQRISDLQAEVDRLKFGLRRSGQRHRSEVTVLGLPLYDIAIGPDLDQNEIRGHAKGIIAIGDTATGVVACGGFARGVFAFGGGAIGLLIACGGGAIGGVSLGGGALGLIAFGGLAIGGFAAGGAAIGAVAIGSLAVGYYACGSVAIGAHVIDIAQQDPIALNFFRRWVPLFDQLRKLF